MMDVQVLQPRGGYVRVWISECGRIGEIDAAKGITHLDASTLVLGQLFHVIRTESMPS